jgi:hypothetical protein
MRVAVAILVGTLLVLQEYALPVKNKVHIMSYTI